MKLIQITIVFLLVFVGSSCDKKEVPVITPTTKKVEQLEEAMLKYGYDQFKTLSNEESGNVIISPLSIASALYMTCDGAAGSTADEMEQTLHISEIAPDHNQLYEKYIQKIEDTKGQPELTISNQIFADFNGISLNDDFKKNSNTFYGAETQELDFRDTRSVDVINDWVKDATEERIPKVLENISPDEVMFLINALYFKGDWDNGFPDYGTFPRPFTLMDGQVIMANTMSHDAVFSHVTKENFSAVEMPFKDSLYSMTFILPNAESTPLDFLSSYDSDSFSSMFKTLPSEYKQERIFVQLPKMELKTKYDLKSSLSSLGMESAFSQGNADFSNFGSADGNLFLTRVLHDVFIKIDEKGVEGAAATTVGVGVTSVPPSFYMNRPFLFVLRHVESDVPVFMGLVNDPTE